MNSAVTRNDTQNLAAACPSGNDLRAYGLGLLPLPRLEEVSAHIDACPECDETLRGLHEANDTLVARLRRYVPPGPPDTATFPARDTDRTDPILADRRTTARFTPRQFGSYELLEELERGGMGVVYVARQAPLNRLVALKMIRTGAHAGAAELARFRVEAEAVARLQHQNVIQIYDFGEADGQPYFAMEYLAGGTLSKQLAARTIPQTEAAELMRTVAGAVHAAHQQQIVHRDLKPANVLLTADGTPKVADFGLAKLLDDDAGLTVTDTVVGTPSYMAPEQARGGGEIGPAADVYALGAILYHALAGRPPFKGATRNHTLDQVKTQDPPSPASFRPQLHPDLIAVCLKCLEKDPARRYASAQALADDLGRWLRGEPTLARPLRWPARVRRRVRRHPGIVGLAAACLVVVLGITVTLYSANPDRPLQDWQRDLAKGKPVVLIGESGKPPWSQWRASEARLELDRDGTAKIWGSDRVSLLELLPDPGLDKGFRFRAEVRHDEGNPMSDVGIYWGRGGFRDEAGPHEFFCSFGFNDLFRRVELRESDVRLRLQATRPDGSATEKVSPARSLRFLPEMHWRQLALEVRPDSVACFWDGVALPPVRCPDLLNELDLDRLRVPKGLPAFSLRNGLGLYVSGSGTASFRRVVVEPLK